MNSDINTSAFSFAAPKGLRVNLLASAFGIPKAAPVFSWVMRSGDDKDIQTSYRILIAGRSEDMKQGNYLIDTGWTASDESSNITIAGLDTVLQDNELYYWAVQLRNRSGAESTLSDPMPFTTAIGTAWEDTRGIWSPDTDGNGDFAFLRTEFKVPDIDAVERAVLSVTATSPEPSRRYVYHAYLNGNFVGLGPTRIGKSVDGEDVLYYDSYDITAHLAPTSALGVICYTKEEKSFLCQLTVFYKNGSRRVLLNSARDAETFLGMDGTRVFASGNEAGTYFFKEESENINATAYPFGFDRPEFSAASWSPVCLRDDVEIEHQRHLEPRLGEPIGRYLQDVALVERRENGSIFIDMGHEIIGGVRLTLTSPAVHSIRLHFGEELNADGSVRYAMRTTNTYRETWTLREGKQTLENFGMKGFRYVEIFDCPVMPEEQDVRGVAIRQAFDPEESSFTCSNEILCRLYDTFKYAVCTTTQQLYVDSQTRERAPYEGDAVINMLAACTYTGDLSTARNTVDYLISHRTWPADYALLAVHLVRLDYQYSGNRSLMERSYGTLRRMVLSEKVNEDVGLIPSKAPADNTWDSIIVDWPIACRDGYFMDEAYFNTVYNAVYYLSLRDLTAMAMALGKEDDAMGYRVTADNLRSAMIERLYRPDKGAYIDGLHADGSPVEHFSQHATAYALCMNVYDSEQMKDALCRTLVGQNTVKTSLYGAYYLLDGLYRAGFGAYATALLASDDVTPGAHTFAAALKNTDATIGPEAWCFEEKPNMTLSHPWSASPAVLIVQGMFGIRPTRPGFHRFEVRPQIGSLPYAAIRVPTVKGTIGVSLGQNREAYEAEVIVPPNSKATVYLPVLPGGTNTLFVNNRIANFPIEKGCYHIELGSGTHRLLAQ